MGQRGKKEDPSLTPFSEIGERLGMSKQLAKQVYDRAIRKLRKRFSRYPELRQQFRDLLDGANQPETFAETSNARVREDVWFPREIHEWSITPVPKAPTRLLYRAARSISDDFKKKNRDQRGL